MDTHIASSMEEAMPFGLDFCLKRLEGRGGLCPVDGQKKNGPASELAKPIFICPWLPWQPPPIKSLLFPKLRLLPAVQEFIWFASVVQPYRPNPALGGITIVTSSSATPKPVAMEDRSSFQNGTKAAQPEGENTIDNG